MDLENRTLEVVVVIFRKVLSCRPRYARGLGEMDMPKLNRRSHYGVDVSGTSQDAKYYKAQLKELKSNIVQNLLQKQVEYDKFMTYSVSQQQS